MTLEKQVLSLPSMRRAQAPLSAIKQVICLSSCGYPALEEGAVYMVKEWQVGVFPDRPFVLVWDRGLSVIAAHASRFAPAV